MCASSNLGQHLVRGLVHEAVVAGRVAQFPRPAQGRHKQKHSRDCRPIRSLLLCQVVCVVFQRLFLFCVLAANAGTQTTHRDLCTTRTTHEEREGGSEGESAMTMNTRQYRFTLAGSWHVRARAITDHKQNLSVYGLPRQVRGRMWARTCRSTVQNVTAQNAISA